MSACITCNCDGRVSFVFKCIALPVNVVLTSISSSCRKKRRRLKKRMHRMKAGLTVISLLVLGRSTCCSRSSCRTYSSKAGPNLFPSGPCNRGFAFVNFKSAEKAKTFSEAKECKSKPFKPSAVLEATLLRTS